MNAIDFLKGEHSKIREALNQITKTSDIGRKKTKFLALCKDLVKHEKMEQKIWYPVLRKHEDLREIIQHLLAEEKSAAQAIKAFQHVRFDFMWKLRFAKFKHDVNHHAKEEEKELFPKVRKLFDKTQLDKLGIAMRKFKKGL